MREQDRPFGHRTTARGGSDGNIARLDALHVRAISRHCVDLTGLSRELAITLKNGPSPANCDRRSD